MLALHITSMKQFMNQLLVSDAFDIFLLEEAVITTANTYTLDGYVNREFYSPEDLNSGQIPDYEYSPWSTMKGLCFQLIKGKRTPLSFRFIFHLKPEQALKLLEKANCSVEPSSIKALVLTIRYDGTKAVLTTGCAYHAFVMSKEAEQIWDKALTRYLSGKNIPYEML
ncbi:MAG: hypothetical protein IJZ34_18340 [Lachnospiraceae bacterium]|nr:hypothetical protein [Lachnospiraceae bacterium]